MNCVDYLLHKPIALTILKTVSGRVNIEIKFYGTKNRSVLVKEGEEKDRVLLLLRNLWRLRGGTTVREIKNSEKFDVQEFR